MRQTVGANSDSKAGRKAVMREVETRDWKWLYSGTVSSPDTTRYSSKRLKRMKRETPNEWDGYVALSKNGIAQRLLLEDRSASANIDFEWITAAGKQYWELKTPMSGEFSLSKLLEEGYSKWSRLSADGAAVPKGFDLSNLGMPRMVVGNRFSKMADKTAENTIRKQMSYLSEHGDFEFSEAVLITKKGKLRRIFK